ncbi:MAG: 3'(2'),5'-bisphosphate nucleotidase CysQ [Alphaproteobacteria bacterium]|nr:3'(2'),5'-bisphosphate nucleotidase CysQ [Alphaproteobacteria bacterium]
MDQYLRQLSELALIAGQKIIQIYVKDFKVDTKQDTSPVTEADRLAEDIIVAGLKRITPNIPIIAEEMAAEGALPKLSSNANESFYLVDPLDGTKEFIHKRGEFTVNIALIKNHKPIIGIIFAPTLNQLYVANVEQKYAQMFKLNDEFNLSNPLSQTDISAANIPNEPFKILASRSHINAQTEAYIEDLRKKHNELEIANIGSSLKLCLLAEGEADIYPRFGPTMEWDIAAGHAILSAAGGYIKTDTGDDFIYGDQKNEFRNGNFIAYS